MLSYFEWPGSFSSLESSGQGLIIIGKVFTSGVQMKQDFLFYFFRVGRMIKSPPFIVLTVVGNLFILLCSYIFYILEAGKNPLVGSAMDAIWWSFTTVTTVGYGDVVPNTIGGRVLGILMMLMGTGLFATYTALFANALLGKEVSRIDKKVKIIDRSVAGMQFDLVHEEANIERTLANLGSHIKKIEKKLNELTKD